VCEQAYTKKGGRLLKKQKSGRKSEGHFNAREPARRTVDFLGGERRRGTLHCPHRKNTHNRPSLFSGFLGVKRLAAFDGQGGRTKIAIPGEKN